MAVSGDVRTLQQASCSVRPSPASHAARPGARIREAAGAAHAVRPACQGRTAAAEPQWQHEALQAPWTYISWHGSVRQGKALLLCRTCCRPMWRAASGSSCRGTCSAPGASRARPPSGWRALMSPRCRRAAGSSRWRALQPVPLPLGSVCSAAFAAVPHAKPEALELRHFPCPDATAAVLRRVAMPSGAGILAAECLSLLADGCREQEVANHMAAADGGHLRRPQRRLERLLA